MRRVGFVLPALVFALLCGWMWAAQRSRAPLDVGIVDIRYAIPTGVPVFSITNASDVPILRSPRCWIRMQGADEKVPPSELWLGYGTAIPPRGSELVRVVAAPTQGVWSIAFEMTKYGTLERLHACPQAAQLTWSRWIHQDERELSTTPGIQ